MMIVPTTTEVPKSKAESPNKEKLLPLKLELILLSIIFLPFNLHDFEKHLLTAPGFFRLLRYSESGRRRCGFRRRVRF